MEAELLMRAGALELNSNHPLTRAIVDGNRKRRNIELVAADNFETIKAKVRRALSTEKPFGLDRIATRISGAGDARNSRAGRCRKRGEP
ncbi:MAG: hypothetical protein R3C05_27950 [Pirellulaceae bacterium]